jgi:FeS assembly SUF system regulator
MLRISRLTDYGTMILVYLASHGRRMCSASDVASGTHVALPTVQKILKLLARAGLVMSARGVEGGYSLARTPQSISAADILNALEGPVAITECSDADSHCQLETRCQVGNAWQKINKAIRVALDDITLDDMIRPPREFPLINMTRGLGVGLGRPERN